MLAFHTSECVKLPVNLLLDHNNARETIKTNNYSKKTSWVNLLSMVRDNLPDLTLEKYRWTHRFSMYKYVLCAAHDVVVASQTCLGFMVFLFVPCFIVSYLIPEPLNDSHKILLTASRSLISLYNTLAETALFCCSCSGIVCQRFKQQRIRIFTYLQFWTLISF